MMGMPAFNRVQSIASRSRVLLDESQTKPIVQIRNKPILRGGAILRLYRPNTLTCARFITLPREHLPLHGPRPGNSPKNYRFAGSNYPRQESQGRGRQSLDRQICRAIATPMRLNHGASSISCTCARECRRRRQVKLICLTDHRHDPLDIGWTRFLRSSPPFPTT